LEKKRKRGRGGWGGVKECKGSPGKVGLNTYFRKRKNLAKGFLGGAGETEKKGNSEQKFFKRIRNDRMEKRLTIRRVRRIIENLEQKWASRNGGERNSPADKGMRPWGIKESSCEEEGKEGDKRC